MNREYTEKEIHSVAKELIDSIEDTGKATVFAFEGDLGAGKTTLTKAIAKELGIEDSVASPTFVIQKSYRTKNEKIKNLVHVDAYRLKEGGELEMLGFKTLLKEPQTLIVVEWPSLVETAIPDTARWFDFSHQTENSRIIKEKHA